MRIIVNILVFIFCVFATGCTSYKSAIPSTKSSLMKNIVLLKTIPGGSRAHILILSTDGMLKYNVGALSELDSYDFENVKIDSNYSQKTVVLNSNEISEINNLISLVENSPYKDLTVAKDNMQYYVYFDDAKMMFGYERNFSEYPKEWRSLISYLVNSIGKLHKIPGMS